MKRLIVFITCFSFSTVLAQSVMFYQNYDYSRQIYQQMDRIAETNRINDAVTSGSRTSAGNAPNANSASPAAALSFKPSSTVSDMVTKVMLRNLSKEEDKPVSQVRAEMTAQEDKALPPVVIAQILKARGFPVNNLASYFSVFVITSYNIIAGKPFTNVQQQFLYRRNSRLLSKGFASNSDAQRQQMSEYLAWQTQKIFEQNRRSPQAAKASALSILGEFGLDQAKLELLAAR